MIIELTKLGIDVRWKWGRRRRRMPLKDLAWLVLQDGRKVNGEHK
jgi:hypothetical protein